MTKYGMSPQRALDVLVKEFPELGDRVEVGRKVLEPLLETKECLTVFTELINMGVWRVGTLNAAQKLLPWERQTNAWHLINDVGEELLELIQVRFEGLVYDCCGVKE